MATLEVHNGSGAVEYVTIRREQPVVFGSDPKCDIRLSGPGVLPFHGRIGWKGDRYRVEAFPESKSLDFNGKQVISASFRTGDEVRIGPCVIYMSQSDDPGGKATAAPAATRPEAATPRAQARPVEAPAPRARSVAAAAATATAVAAPAAPKPIHALLDLFTSKGPDDERVLSSPLVLALVMVMFGLSAAGVYLYKEIRRSSADQIC
ncbi:MAG: FHA domain-containing protein [Isosphaeraceae bacterium]